MPPVGTACATLRASRWALCRLLYFYEQPGGEKIESRSNETKLPKSRRSLALRKFFKLKDPPLRKQADPTSILFYCLHCI